LENEEETEEVYFYDAKKKNPVGLPRDIRKILTRKYSLLFDLDEEEEQQEDYLVYQPVVYPPGTTPPAPQFTKRMNFVDFNQIK